jgi:hypothetical protein
MTQQDEPMTDVVLMMPDTPAEIQELAKQIVNASKDGPSAAAMGMACLFVACACIAAIEDDDLRNTIVEEMGELAAACIRANREELARRKALVQRKSTPR